MFWLKRIVAQKLNKLGALDITTIKRRCFRFQRVLKNYGKILELLADAFEKQGGGFVLDKQYLVALTTKLFDLAESMLYDLNVLAEQQHLDCYDTLDHYKKETKEIITGSPTFLTSELVIPFSNYQEFLPQKVGRENAFLIELHHRMNVPIPEGFALTYSAYQRIIEENNLKDLIKFAVDKFQKNAPTATKELLTVQEQLKKATIPSDLKDAVVQVLNPLKEKFGNELLLTLNFSIGEKNPDPFGLQREYTKTISKVNVDAVLDTYIREISHLYDPAQVLFRQIKRMGENVALSVLCKRIILEKSRGKLSTLDPSSDSMLLFVRVDEDNHWNRYKISRTPSFDIIPLREEDEDSWGKDQSRMRSNQESIPFSTEVIGELITLGLRIERYCQKAQEIEWGLDQEGKCIITKTQPLSTTSTSGIGRKNLAKFLKGHQMIYDNAGRVAARGLGWGKVFVVQNEGDLKDFPEQGVLVTKALSPEWEFSPSLQKAGAILTDSGKLSGTLVDLIRWFHIPCLADLGDVSCRLKPGTMVTVDADENIVYEGRVDELVNYHLMEGLGYEDEPEYQRFQIIQDKIAPLTLSNLTHSLFTAGDCQTIHDVAHLAYENAVRAFTRSNWKGFFLSSRRLEGNWSLVFQVIDIGDGLKPEKSSKPAIDPEDINSRPMIALVKAFFAPDVWGNIILREKVKADSPGITDNPFQTRSSIAVVSKEYLNLSINQEGEASMVDAYLCEEAGSNYIFCRFSKAEERGSLSFLAQEVMHQLEFEVEKTPSAIHAWKSCLHPQTTEEHLHLIGHLILFTQLVDTEAPFSLSPKNLAELFFQNLPKVE